jgi:hypothetical protein
MRMGRRAIVALVCLAVLAAGCGEQSASDAETQLAEQLQTELQSLGVEVQTSTLIALFGDDGGHLCIEAEQGNDYIDTSLVSHRFALRKTSVDAEDVEFAQAVIDVYCPDERPVFDEFVAGLEVGGSS